MVSLRHSSIRPDLPKLLEEIHELGIDQYDQFCLTQTVHRHLFMNMVL